MNPITKTEFWKKQINSRNGRIARQGWSSFSVIDDTVVLQIVVGKRLNLAKIFFRPDYQEKTYAAGKIPGGFFKREGRPSEKEHHF